jgi:hypothetical protein
MIRTTNKHERSIRGIVNKGVISFRKLLPALKFTHCGYERTPLFLYDIEKKLLSEYKRI